MKDALIKQSPTVMAKSGTKKRPKDLQKEKKNCAKRPKEPKIASKSYHSEKIKKVKKIEKKLSKKGKEHKSKKSEKKISRTQKKQKKKVGRKKNTKEQKTHLKKSLKTGEAKRGRKRKLTEETSLGPPPNKIAKTIEMNNSLLINGTPKIVPQTTRNPWVLKLDVSSPSNNLSITNDNKNVIKKSVFYIPKKNAMSSIIMKSNLGPITGNHIEMIGTSAGEVLNGKGLPNNSKNKTISASKGIIVKKVELDSKLFPNRKCLQVSKRNAPSSTKALISSSSESTKTGPRQRMASLDALAKMHVICTTDRKSALEPSKNEINDTHHHSKLINEHMESRFDLKGGKLDNNFSSQLYRSKINYSVKGKQQTWKFVSQSLEQSSIDHEEESSGNLSSLISQQHNQETVVGKRKRGRPKLNRETRKNSNVAKKSKITGKGKNLPTVEKRKDMSSSKSTKADNSEAVKKVSVKGTNLSSVIKKSQKDENRSKPKAIKAQQLKVRETFRMRKTCTYQSVTLNSHEDPRPNNLNKSQIGLTNYTKVRKTNQLTLLPNKQNDKTDSQVSPSSPGVGLCCYGSNIHAAEKPTSPSPPRQPVAMEAPDCCACHSQSRIPMAHVQSCPFGHRVPLESQFDSNYHMHRFQQHFMYSHPSPGEYSCCCSSCLMHLSYPPHLPPHSHLPSSSPSFKPEGLCCHHHSSSQNIDPDIKHQYNLASGCSSTHWHSWCTCCELDSTQHGGCPCQKNSSCITPEYAHQALVPCDQSPLDLSRASSSVGVSEQALRPHCSNSVFHGDILHFKGPHTFSAGSANKSENACFGNNVHTCTNVTRLCSRDYDSEIMDCTSDVKENPQLMQLTTNKAHKTVHIIHLRQHHQLTEKSNLHPSYTSSREGSTVFSLAEGTSSSFLHQLDGCHHFSTSIRGCSREVESTLVKPIQPFVSSPGYHEDLPSNPDKRFPQQSQSHLPISKKPSKRKFSHGWCWEGEPTERLIAFTNDSVPCLQKCYPAMRHKEGDIIKERDCVLLKSGSKDTDLPFVAKIAAFWENPDDGEMMMSLLWYYRPEHTEQGRKPGQMEDEVFASKHRDVNSVACIEDKCYVLTFAEYCRYRAQLCLPENSVISHSLVVPEPDEDDYSRVNRLPPDFVAPEMVFFCRSVYDYRQKRILKNPM